MNRILVVLGVVLIALGLLWPWVRRLPLFKLPGDIVIERPGFQFFFPITTMLVVSLAISIIAWILRR
jgi:MFS superfamily sulfate permease-like transporter